MNYRRHLLIASVLVVLVTVVAYFLLTVGYPLPQQASVEARSIDTLINAHFWVIAFLFSLVAVMMLYGLIVFRRREGDEGDGDHVHGSTLLEILWTVVPLILVVAFGDLGCQFALTNDLAEAKPNQIPVHVQGQRWNWNFSYPELEVNAPTNFRSFTRIEEDPYDQ